MNDCQRCGAETGYSETSTKLIGGVNATLCLQCKNEWHRVATQSPAFARQEELEARKTHFEAMALARQPKSEAEYLQVIKDDNENSRAFFALGLDFIRPLPGVGEGRKPKAFG